jgi:hypothetical protein
VIDVSSASPSRPEDLSTIDGARSDVPLVSPVAMAELSPRSWSTSATAG